MSICGVKRPLQIELPDADADAGAKSSKGDFYSEGYNSQNIRKAIQILTKISKRCTSRIGVIDTTLQTIPKDDRKHRSTLQSERDELQRLMEYNRFLKKLDTTVPVADAQGIRWNRLSYSKKEYRGGRRYANGVRVYAPSEKYPRSVSLQGCMRDLRVLLAGDRLIDIDMVNAFPTIAHYVACRLGLSLPKLAYYSKDSTNRDLVLSSIMEFHGIYSRDAAKELPITLLHGGSYDCWLREYNLSNKRGRLPFMESFSNDVKTLMARLLDHPQWATLRSDVRVHLVKTGKRKEKDQCGINRSTFAIILQELEDRALQSMVRTFRRNEWVVESLQFDGCLLRHRPDVDIEKTIQLAQAQIKKDVPGLEIVLKVKPLYKESLQPFWDALNE